MDLLPEAWLARTQPAASRRHRLACHAGGVQVARMYAGGAALAARVPACTRATRRAARHGSIAHATIVAVEGVPARSADAQPPARG